MYNVFEIFKILFTIFYTCIIYLYYITHNNTLLHIYIYITYNNLIFYFK